MYLNKSISSLWSALLIFCHTTCSPLQVGELYSSCHGNPGRQSLAFHLNARPSAVLNFHDILEDAGHFVSERWVRNMCLPLHWLFSVVICCRNATEAHGLFLQVYSASLHEGSAAAI